MHKRTQRGVAVVEFVIILPILLNLLFVAYVLAQGFYRNMVLINAVRLGAQYAAVNQSEDIATIKDRVLAEARLDLGNMQADDIDVVVMHRCANGSTPSNSGVCTGTDTEQWTYVSIAAAYSYLPDVPYLPDTISLRQTAEFRIK